MREREHVLANRVGKRKAEKIAAGIVLKGCKKKQAANADPTKLRKTFQLSDAPVEQAMVTDLYGSIPPSLWTQSRRNENPDGPFDAPPVLTNERIYGVARAELHGRVRRNPAIIGGESSDYSRLIGPCNSIGLGPKIGEHTSSIEYC